jgi:hypothetical protein
MQIEYEGKVYTTQYFPFFRIKRRDGYQVFGIRYPSGSIERVVIFDSPDYMKELKNYLIFLVKEYIVEDDEMLTPYAKRLKEDIRDLFDEKR